MKLNNNFKIIFMLITILAIGLISYDFLRLHKPINLSDVESVNIWGNTSNVARNLEKQDIVKWFNSITNIRENKDFAGTTPDAGIIITLKTGNRISIINSGADFEVQRISRSGNAISYRTRNARELSRKASDRRLAVASASGSS